MARYTSEAAAAMVGNRFDLVLMASHRARELKHGHVQRVEGTDATTVVTALREIEAGKYTKKEWYDTLPKTQKGQRE
jgi:DNA-directed RNA polymerase subunit omega